MSEQIPSVSDEVHMTRNEYEDLKRQLSQIKTENKKLRTVLRRHNLKLPKTEPCQRTPKGPQPEKGYLRSTIASRNKNSQFDSAETLANPEETSKCISDYQDGQLPWAHFMQGTRSSCNKRRSKFGAEDSIWDDAEDSGCCEAEPTTTWGSYQMTESEKEQSLEAARERREREVLYQKNYEKGKALEKELEEKTGRWRVISPQLSEVPLKSEETYSFLRRGLRLAQEIFHDAVNKHLPKVAPRFTCPEEVAFGRGEMERRCFSFLDGRMDFGGRLCEIWEFESRVHDVACLRNKVCHYSTYEANQPLEKYESLLIEVHRLALLFLDEKRAWEVRALRDELAARAQESLAEMERLLHLSVILPEPPWENFHMHGLERAACIIERYSYRYSEYEYDEPVSEMPRCMLLAAQDLLHRFPRRFDWSFMHRNPSTGLLSIK
ncbi:hypothetical protein F4677DRAFT_449283 [Hypoxylon crocopeplum]|nr:hypothetical protein F4677DRAFT_449283 [Hypoxylon crocopeplum]